MMATRSLPTLDLKRNYRRIREEIAEAMDEVLESQHFIQILQALLMIPFKFAIITFRMQGLQYYRMPQCYIEPMLIMR